MQRDALLAFAVRVASTGLLYLSQVMLAGWMGGYEYGIYVFVWTWVLILGGLSQAGLNLGMIRLVAEYREQGHQAELRGLMRAGVFWHSAAARRSRVSGSPGFGCSPTTSPLITSCLRCSVLFAFPSTR